MKYTILKNWHYAFFLFGRLFGWGYNKKKHVITFKFSKECWWNPPRNQDDYDLNKLAGISFGLLGIHKNSVRLTWKPKFEKEGILELYGYVFDSSQKYHMSKYICDVKTDNEYVCILSFRESDYLFDMWPFGSITMENKTIDNKLQKIVYPYFGGNNKSPRKMYFWVKTKKG